MELERIRVGEAAREVDSPTRGATAPIHRRHWHGLYLMRGHRAGHACGVAVMHLAIGPCMFRI